MREDPVDRLIRLAWLEGHIRTHGAYARAVARRTPLLTAGRERTRALEEKLAAALPCAAQPEAAAESVGEFLRALRPGGLPPAEIRERLGLTAAAYRRLERDETSPMALPAAVWRSFRTLFALPADTFERLLHGTHRLVVFRPAFRSALARHRPGSAGASRREDLEGALRELYLRAPLELPEDEVRRMEALLRDIG